MYNLNQTGMKSTLPSTSGVQTQQGTQLHRPVDDKTKSCWSKMTQWVSENKSSLLLSGVSAVAIGASVGLGIANVITGVLALAIAIFAALFFGIGVVEMIARASGKNKIA
jgi:hypothetical protein